MVAGKQTLYRKHGMETSWSRWKEVVQIEAGGMSATGKKGRMVVAVVILEEWTNSDHKPNEVGSSRSTVLGVW